MRKLISLVAVAVLAAAASLSIGFAKATPVHADAADEVDDGWYCMRADPVQLYPWDNQYYFYDCRWDPDTATENYYWTGVRCY